MREVLVNGVPRVIRSEAIYRHFKFPEKKHPFYIVMGFAKDSTTENEMVIYRNIGGNKGAWVRSLEEFSSEVDREKYPDARQKYRFQEV